MSKVQRLVIVFCLLLLLIPIGISLFFVFPMGDDYSYARMGQTKSLLEITIGEYNTWNGRFFSNLLVVLNPIRWNNWWLYLLVPLVQLVLLFGCVRLVLGRFILVEDRFSFVALSLLILLCYVAGMPTIAEGLFWYTGSVTYWLGSCMFLTCVYLYKSHSNIMKLVILPCLICATCGMNEVLALWLCLVSIALCFSKWSTYHALICSVSLLSFLLVYLAPGNAIRASHFQENHQFFYSLWMTLLQFVRFTLIWLVDIKLITLIAVTAVLPIKLQVNWSSKISFTRYFVYLTVGYFSLVCLTIFPAYWSTGIMGQHRTINMAYLVFLFYILLLIFGFKSTKQTLPLERFLSPKLVVFSLSFLIIQGNLKTCISAWLTGSLHGYKKELNDRINQIKWCNQDTLHLKPLTDVPAVVLNYELEHDPNSWKNTCYADFYNPGLKIVLDK